MKQTVLTWNDVERMCMKIVSNMARDKWLPDYIVGIVRGGSVPATIISHMLNTKCYALKVSLNEDKTHNDTESNCWMSENAFGYIPESERFYKEMANSDNRKHRILIVDDINDTGETINWIRSDWETTCLPDKKTEWHCIWENNVRFATLVNNTTSAYDGVSYYGHEINKDEDPSWIVFPWENVAEYGHS